MSNSTNRHQELKAILDRLKLSGMAQHFPDLALRAAKEGLSHEAYLHELARQEEAIRQERRTDRLLRQSGLPLEKTFRTFELSRLSPTLQLQIERLKSGAFLEHSVNVIAAGNLVHDNTVGILEDLLPGLAIEVASNNVISGNRVLHNNRVNTASPEWRPENTFYPPPTGPS